MRYVLAFLILSVSLNAYAGDLSTHFSKKDFRCKCCGKVVVNQELVKKLEQLRSFWDKKVIVTSGYRCPEHNVRIGGSKRSYHTKGMASDIVIVGVSPKEVAVRAKLIGFTGVKGYRSWTHVDVRPGKLTTW